MIKVKDAFRRIGGQNVQAKRKDTPVPASNTQMVLAAGRNDQHHHNGCTPIAEDLVEEVTPNGGEHDGVKMHESKSTPTFIEEAPKRSRKKSNRKNSTGQRTRSCEDLTTLGNRRASIDYDINKAERRSSSQRIHHNRRGGGRAKRRDLVQSYEPNKLLEKAIEEGYTDLCVDLIQSGQVNINKLNGFGFAPLHLAACEGKDDIVKILIDNGAYIDILTSTGLSALQAAVMEGSFDCAQMLIENGADQGFVMDGPLNPRKTCAPASMALMA